MSLRSVSSICPVDYEKQLFVYFILFYFYQRLLSACKLVVLQQLGQIVDRTG